MWVLPESEPVPQLSASELDEQGLLSALGLVGGEEIFAFQTSVYPDGPLGLDLLRIHHLWTALETSLEIFVTQRELKGASSYYYYI